MAEIGTLIKDIYNLLDEGVEVDQKDADEFGRLLSKIITDRLAEQRNRKKFLRLSNIGTNCDKKLWLEVNRPEVVEPLPPQTRLKFLYGDILECLLLFLAKASGHEVTGQQDECEINGVKGHRDGVIDGMLVDVKSASSYSFKKFFNHLKPEDDSFGYLRQIGGYLEAAQDDPLVTDKKQAAFLVVDKVMGHLTLDIHKKDDLDYEKLVAEKLGILDLPNPPPRAFGDLPDGASGNRKLGIECSYCAVRQYCWPGLRTFAYSNGLRHLTKVALEPKVDEIK